MHKLKSQELTPLMTAAAVIISQAFIMAIAFAAATGEIETSRVWLVPGTAVLCGALAYFFHDRGWYALLLAYLLGLVVGDISALDLANQPVERLFAVCASTVVFFATLGLAVGAIAELSRFIHYLLHGGRPRLYPWGRRDKQD